MITDCQKLSLDEAKKLFTELYSEQIKKDLQMEEDKKILRKHYPSYSPLASNDPEATRAWKKFDKKYADNPDFSKSFEEQSTATKIFMLENYIPIALDKRCCMNCSYCICDKRNIANNPYAVCNEWHSPTETKLYYVKPYFMSEEERKAKESETLEMKVNTAVSQAIESYKDLLKAATFYEKHVKKPVVSISKKDLDTYKRLQEDKKLLKRKIDDCYDFRKTETNLPGSDTKTVIHSMSPNSKKIQEFFEDTGMCIEEAQMKLLFGTDLRPKRSKK